MPAQPPHERHLTTISMGLDQAGLNTDSIDALIMFDHNSMGGPANGGLGAERGIDMPCLVWHPA